MKFFDTHTRTTVDRPLVAVTLANGQKGVFVHNEISCINAFDFEQKILSQQSIAGVVYGRDVSLEEAVANFNETVYPKKRIVTFSILEEETA